MSELRTDTEKGEMETISNMIKSGALGEPPVQPEVVVAETPPVEAQVVDITVPAEKTETVIETPVVAAEKPAEIKEVIEPVKTEVDYEKILDEMSGGSIKSKDELTKILSEYKESKDLIESDAYQFATKLSAWEKEGLPTEQFSLIQSLTKEEISTMDAADAIGIRLKLENPDWSEEDIDMYIKEEYKQDKESNSEAQSRVGTLRMQRDANEFRSELDRLKGLTYVPNSENRKVEAQQLESQRIDSWKKAMPNIVQDLNKVSLSIDDKGTLFDFVPTKEQKEEIRKEMEDIIASAPVKFDEEGIKAFKAIMQEKFINKNINHISKAIALKVSSKKEEEKILEIHNPTGARPEAPTPALTKKERSVDDAIEAIVKQEGIRRR